MPSLRLADGWAIIESKSTHGRALADTLLRAAGLRPTASCSKSCLGTSLAQPELAMNPFLLLLRRGFVYPRRPQAAT